MLRAAANKIVANPGSIVGSIGVIAEWINYGDLMQWAKLKEIGTQDRRVQGHRFGVAAPDGA